MMRSFGSRSDTFVSDEPFYGAYLKATADPQPMADEVIASMDCDWQSVAKSMAGPCPTGAPVWYQKHMVHHMVGPISYDDLPGLRHAFLIRDPERVIASYAAKRVAVRPDHLGVERQVEFFEKETDRLGRPPPVIDSADILRDPAVMLELLCHSLEIPWDPAMLKWDAGIRQTDGVWASHWYGAVASSTGFGPPDAKLVELDDDARRIADQCRPFYERLAVHRLTP
jgi:hypothetical protein